MPAISRDDVQAMDRSDDLAGYRAKFELAEGLIYLDGNSLGPLPIATIARLRQGVEVEWGQDLITSWNKHGWMHLPQRLGEKIAPLIGAAPGQVVACDSTSVNLFKLLAAGLKMRPGRRVILSDPGNFPTDLYMVQGLAEMLGPDKCELRLVNEDEIVDAIDEDTAIVMLTHVNFRSGRKHDMKAVTKVAQEKGALMLWDLAHSAGALPVELDDCNVDLAVGCSYKYLNSGPGGPAFLYVAKRHQDQVVQPLSGWHGHASPFEFDTKYEPSGTVDRYLCGTPSVLAMLALEESLDLWATVDMAKVREKSIKLCDLFISLVEERCAGHGFELASPRNGDERGSQVSFAHDEGYAIMQSLIADKVIGDFRAPNLIRFGFTPLYTSYMDVWDAVERLRVIMEEGRHKAAEFQVRAAVT
ncbi:kynureninase [Aestuariispira insulae]|uniref:Kynureninase n=1 Tax=Aestuariispira insulae TaxID=1461337 RepID=A0A3D9HL79_9PROT|nr:kynureninase [Aestuariispira insulae]RED49656.1 kynureninase [Aestuariispira insulae]